MDSDTDFENVSFNVVLYKVASKHTVQMVYL